MSVVWWADAEEDWRRLSYSDAEAVAQAIERWDVTGEGAVYAAGPTEYRLMVGRLVVVFYMVGEVTHVAQVRRA
jgi:hypothetical protein